VHDLAGQGAHTLLLSHVLTEMAGDQTDQLLALASQATAVLWVEPGTQEVSRVLSRLRERLRAEFGIVAPCPHQSTCPMLAAQNAAHWCHHFASPPPDVFTDGNWARFGTLTGIDLRSLPLSFLVLDKRPPREMPSGAARVIGRPRVYKAHGLVLGCTADGLVERRLSKRVLPEQFRQLKRAEMDSLQIWECTGQEITKIQPAAEEKAQSSR
jgi:ribosomal protein RSM22 (predicted rRNA methylase)